MVYVPIRPLGPQMFKTQLLEQPTIHIPQPHILCSCETEGARKICYLGQTLSLFSKEIHFFIRGNDKALVVSIVVLFSSIPGWSRPFPKAFEGPFHFLSVCHRGTLSAASKLIVMPLFLKPTGTFLSSVY